MAVIVPELNYDGMDAPNDANAMESWARIIELPDGADRQRLREVMFKY